MATREDNMAALQRFDIAVNSGNYAAFNDVVAPNAIDHDSVPGQVSGPDGYRYFFTELHSAFPDAEISVDYTVADDYNVAMAYTLTGTHQGPFMGFAPTGKHVKIHGVEICKFADGKLVERWGSSDQLGILEQLGLYPAH